MKLDCVGGLMETAMENIKSMVEVNTIIGDAVETPGGTVIIPVSKMCCGFASVAPIWYGTNKMPTAHSIRHLAAGQVPVYRYSR